MSSVSTLVALWLLVSVPPARARDFPSWFARGEVGAANIHAGSFGFESDLDDLWGTARVGRALGERGLFALDFGVAGSSADGGFTTWTAGLELRAFARSLVSPYGRVEMGYLSEAIGGCFVGSLGAGVAVRVAQPLALRAGIMSGSHCSDGAGPVSASVGLELRW